MIVISTVLAVTAAFVATLVWASVDAGRPLVEETGDQSGDPDGTAPPTTRPITTTTAGPTGLTEAELAAKVAASVRPVVTADESGQRVQGSAFVVGSFGGQTLLLTSFAVVKANTRAPGPGITLDGDRQATLWTWHEALDLALLVVPGAIESLPWAEAPPEVNEKVYVGAAGQRLAVGIALGSSDAWSQHNIFVDDARQGAPLVNAEGEVIGMASRAYNPGGRGTDSVFFAVPINAACERVLRCGSGNAGPGEATATPTTTVP
ncbi:MAG: trypsin-like peptidase domain-containing protein [Actinomycetota bacterium]|jgi:S1-C subfamily serine protease